MTRRPPRSPLFPYTPLFRSLRLPSLDELRAATRAATRDATAEADSIAAAQRELGRRTDDLAQQRSRDGTDRKSTRLNSSSNLVCRLLLAKNQLRDEVQFLET